MLLYKCKSTNLHQKKLQLRHFSFNVTSVTKPYQSKEILVLQLKDPQRGKSAFRTFIGPISSHSKELGNSKNKSGVSSLFEAKCCMAELGFACQ